MKKFMKRMTVTLTVLFAVLGLGTTIAFAGNYIQWNGTQDFIEALENLTQIERAGSDLKVDLDMAEGESRALRVEMEKLQEERNTLNGWNQELKNKVKDKDNKIDSLEQDIEALEKRIDSGQTNKDQLQQAEKDMEEVKQKSADVLNGLK